MSKTRHLGIGMTSQRTRERLVNRLREQGIDNEDVLNQIRRIPRHIFVDEALASRSYEDTALPIGYGQTISQPYIVARMTQAIMDSGAHSRVLEVGTGSGYQAAILASLVDTVYTVERILPLLNQAKRRFMELKLLNIRTKHSDGSWGWEEQAPFDAILAAAAPEQVPQSLLDQLAIGGRLVMPVGPRGGQQLVMIERKAGGFEQQVLDAVRFVPMVEGTER